MNRQFVADYLFSDYGIDYLKSNEGMTNYGPLAYGLFKDNSDIDIPKSLKNDLKDTYFFKQKKDFIVLNILKSLNNSFKNSEIECVLLKGVSVGNRYWSSLSEREYGDLDLLVKETDFKKACCLIEDLGGIADKEVGKWEGNNFKKVYVLNGFPIELHSKLLVYRDGIDIFNDRTISFLNDEIDWIRELDPELNLVYLCGHGAFQHLFDEFYWLIDIDNLLRKEKSLDWNQILDDAKNLRLERPLGLSLSLCKKYFQTNVGPNEIGNSFINNFYPYYITPKNIFKYSHREGTYFYLFLKGCLRSSMLEILKYGLKRIFKS